jgi:hypothetical protein
LNGSENAVGRLYLFAFVFAPTTATGRSPRLALDFM